MPAWIVSLISYVSEQLKTHGLPFVLLALAVTWFNEKNKQLDAKLDICNQAIIKAYQENQTKMIEVIERNSSAFKALDRD